jgi:hypothetical protein
LAQAEAATLAESRKLLTQQLTDKVGLACCTKDCFMQPQHAKLDEVAAELSNKEEQRKTLQAELGTELESQLSSEQQTEVLLCGDSCLGSIAPAANDRTRHQPSREGGQGGPTHSRAGC